MSSATQKELGGDSVPSDAAARSTSREHVKTKPSNARTVFLKNKIKKYYEEAEKERHSVFGSCTCKNIGIFVATYAVLVFTVGGVRQYTASVMEHVHRHFSITAMEQNFLLGAEMIGIAVMLIFAAYYGNKMHKPIAIYSGAMFCAFGSILWSVPYFLEMSRGYNTTLLSASSPEDVPRYYDVGLCQIGRNQSTSRTQCEILIVHPNKTEAYSIIGTGHFLFGAGVSFVMTLGFIFIEESAEKNVSPFYYGIILSLNGLGELFGLIAAWQITALSIHDHSGQIAVAEWDVGAWWIGFPVFAGLFFLVPIPLLFFPKWISEPQWLLSRRRRKLVRTLNLLRKEQRALLRLERKKKRKRQKERERRKKREKKVAESSNEDLTKTKDVVNADIETSQVNLAYDATGDDGQEPSSAQESAEMGMHLERLNGHISEKDIDTEMIPDDDNNDDEDIDDNVDNDDGDNADDAGDDVPETPIGSNLDISAGLETELNQNTISAQQVPTVNANNGTSRVHFDVEVIQEDDMVDNVLQMEEPEKPQITEDTASMKSENSSKTSRQKRQYMLGRRLQDLPNNLWFLINRPVYIITVVGTCFAAYSNFGFRPTVHTYEEAQFPSYDPPNYVTAGLPPVIGHILGLIIAALVLYKRPTSITLHIKVIIILEAVIIVLYLAMMGPNCDPGDFFMDQPTSNSTFTFSSECNYACDCSGSQYNRVCSRNGVMFPSPCHAGCRDVRYMETRNSLVYSRCSCISEFSLSTSYCTSCTAARIGYEFLSFLASLTHALGYVSVLLIFLRCISQKLRSLALGFAIWIVYLASAIPGVAVYEAFQKASCLLRREDCSENSKCWQFRLSTYRYLQNGATCGFQVVASTFYIAVFFVLRMRAKNMRIEKSDNNNKPTPSIAADTSVEEATPDELKINNAQEINNDSSRL